MPKLAQPGSSAAGLTPSRAVCLHPVLGDVPAMVTLPVETS